MSEQPPPEAEQQPAPSAVEVILADLLARSRREE